MPIRLYWVNTPNYINYLFYPLHIYALSSYTFACTVYAFIENERAVLDKKIGIVTGNRTVIARTKAALKQHFSDRNW